MKQLLVIVVAALFSVVTAVSNVVAQPVPASQIIKSDLLAIKGDTYVVKDLFGRFVLLRVDKDTRMERLVLLGIKIDAQVSRDGRALSIKPAT